MSLSSFEIGNLFSVKGKVSIGRAITTALAVNGAKVLIIGRRLATLETTSKEISEQASKNEGQVIAIEGDISSKKGIEEVYEKIKSLTDKVDHLVNNAGFAAIYKVRANIDDPVELEKKLWSIEESDFNDMTKYFMTAPWLLSVKLIPLFKKSSDPAISNITSIGGQTIDRSFTHPAYAGAKAAGLFKSQLTTGSSEVNAPLAPVIQQLIKAVPSGREGRWEEIGGVALLLATPAGAYLNGTDIVIDGGAKLIASA
ncbi:hypothetical protein L486_01874 [Kwoniella mangroviensis CBS 10435]|uniref:Short-chain dehydrogenase n=1 Tax=Kwoniella mangroviensis CBS 10435 TaxID=1331196 RepID=A0A1B9J338_9TREE|nr:hypothetical protein L486_01874 [Kwoniella mangroviensis CBS 10435]